MSNSFLHPQSANCDAMGEVDHRPSLASVRARLLEAQLPTPPSPCMLRMSAEAALFLCGLVMSRDVTCHSHEMRQLQDIQATERKLMGNFCFCNDPWTPFPKAIALENVSIHSLK